MYVRNRREFVFGNISVPSFSLFQIIASSVDATNWVFKYFSIGTEKLQSYLGNCVDQFMSVLVEENMFTRCIIMAN